jgi:hypothetical protein
VCTLRSLTGVANPGGSNAAFMFPMHQLPGEHVQPGKQYLVTEGFYTPQQYAQIGGLEGAVKALNDLQEEMFPGFAEATEGTAVQQHRHHWMAPFLHGPKLPGRSAAIDGLWYAGDGSTPNQSLGIEGACSAGVSRARQIAESLSG